MIQIKKTILTLVALLAVTTGAWATEKMVTINSGTMSSGAVTATGFINLFDNLIVGGDPATITTSEGVITKLVIKKGTIYEDDFTEDNVGVAPGTITYGSDEITVTDINAESVTLSRKGINNWSPSSVDVYYGAPSGPKVAWDNDKKTGTFDMPGGNVELEPEYYPQAALTVAPSAINDVPATTDGAIVNAGTVANIGETANAQGTVMYYVSTTALDDAALLALAADAWTADVPTAESFTAAGQAYVYYYVRGNDGDTDDEIFSDGDILSTNALTVNIAAAPTYAVTFAEGVNPEPPAEPEWTASPATDVKKGQTVTVTYSGTKKVLGVKAEKKAKAATQRPLAEAVAADLGKIAGADGNIYDTKDAAEAAGTTAVAMIAYVGSATEHATYTHGLAIALANANEGEMNWSTAKSSCEGKTAVTGAAWLLPSQNQWKTMFSANGGNENDYTGLQTAANNAGGVGTLQQGTTYWTSTESGDNAYSVDLHGVKPKANFYSDPKTNYYYARPVLAF